MSSLFTVHSLAAEGTQGTLLSSGRECIILTAFLLALPKKWCMWFFCPNIMVVSYFFLVAILWSVECGYTKIKLIFRLDPVNGRLFHGCSLAMLMNKRFLSVWLLGSSGIILYPRALNTNEHKTVLTDKNTHEGAHQQFFYTSAVVDVFNYTFWKINLSFQQMVRSGVL